MHMDLASRGCEPLATCLFQLGRASFPHQAMEGVACLVGRRGLQNR